MEIKKAEFITSVADIRNYPLVSTYDIPEICVVGRSNVGKSSFINCVTARNKLAKTSSTPGRTRLINLFNVNDEFILVDLPGYGYADAPETEKRKWTALIEGYFALSKKIAHVFSLVDVRHDPSVLDEQMLGFLYHYALPFTVVATKSDKISKSKQAVAKINVANKLKIGRDNVICFSSHNKSGREEVLNKIDEILKNRSLI